MYQNDPLKCLTGEVRLSYCNLNEPRKPQNGQGEAKYGVTLLIPKTDTNTLNDLMAAFNAAIELGVTSKWGGVRPPRIDLIIHDGDGERANGTPFGDECKGKWVLTANSTKRPQVVGMDNINVELDPRDVYSGMWGRVTVRFFPFNTAGKRGVGCGLGNVLKTRDDEPLAGGASASVDFAGVGNTIPAAAAPAAPAAPGYPAPGAYQPGMGYVPQQAVTGQATQPAMRRDPVTGQPVPVR